VLSAGLQLDGAADHGVSVALYLRDPDQNGVELYWDKPKQEWPHGPDGKLAMVNARVDLKDLLNQATI
jgi:catechol 2,3-dioxygenase